MRAKTRLLWVFLGVLAGCAGCDHASKRLATEALAGAGSVSIAGDAIRLQLASNPGAFLGMGAGLPEGVRHVLLMVLVPLVLLWLFVRLLRTRAASLPLAVGTGLIVGGGLANWLDRLLHAGRVTDFLVVGLGPLHTGVFNLADVAVVCGVLVWVAATREGSAPCRS